MPSEHLIILFNSSEYEFRPIYEILTEEISPRRIWHKSLNSIFFFVYTTFIS